MWTYPEYIKLWLKVGYSVALAVSLTLLPGCYAGLAGIVVGLVSLADQGGGGNFAPIVSDVEVSHSRISPALVSFRLTDAESNPVDVEITFQAPADGGRVTNAERLPTSPDGITYTRDWDFASQLGTAYRSGVTVSVSLLGAKSADSFGPFGLGNDPPRIERVEPPTDAEVVGLADMAMVVSDSSEDLISIAMEYRVLGEERWHVATPVRYPMEGCRSCLEGRQEVLDLVACPDCFAIRDLKAATIEEGGTHIIFVWDAVKDLGRKELDVEVRCTPYDGLLFGDAFLKGFRVDNNNAPTVDVLNIAGFDQSFEIPISFAVRDDEADQVSVVLQWAPENEDFPEPPAGIEDPAYLERVLSSAEAEFLDLRERHHLLSEAPRIVSGDLDSDSGLELDEIRATDFVRHGLCSRPVPLDPGETVTEDVPVLLEGREVRLIDAASGLDDLRRIEDFDPLRSVAKLDRPLEVRPPPGARYALGANEGLNKLSSSPGGLVHVFLWDSFKDLYRSGRRVDSRVKIRALGIDSEAGEKSGPVVGQLENDVFARVQDLNAGARCDGIAAGDFNGDSRIDIIVGNVESTSLSRMSLFLFERANSCFQERSSQELTVGARLKAMRAGDVTGDGRDDLLAVVTDASGATALVFPQEGGSLPAEPRLLLSLGSPGKSAEPVGLAIADIKEDPDQLNDVVLASSVSGAADELLLFYQTPEAGLSPSPDQRLTAGEGLQAIAVRDLDGDGRNDIVAVASRQAPSPKARIILFYQEGSAEPLPAWNKVEFLGSDSPRFVGIGDLNGDARRDLAVVNWISRTTDIYLQGEQGSFGEAQAGWVDPSVILRSGSEPAALFLEDFNHDSLTDVLVIDGAAKWIGVYLQLEKDIQPGGRDFSEATSLEISTDVSPTTAAMTDLDGDGRSDLILGLDASPSVRLYHQCFRGTVHQDSARILRTTGGLRRTVVRDVSGDGRNDILVLDRESSSLTLYEQTILGTIPEEPTQTLNFAQEALPWAIAAGDLDGDGRNDIAVAAKGDGTLRLYDHDQPSGLLGSEVQYAVTGFPIEVAIGDVFSPFDGKTEEVPPDGRNEIVVLSTLENLTLENVGKLTAYRRVPGAGLEEVQSIDLGSYSPPLEDMEVFKFVDLGDLNGDCEWDAAVLNRSSKSVEVYLQAGGRLEHSQSLWLNDASKTVTIGDTNGDGRNDLAVGFYGSVIAVFLQRQDGTFPATWDRLLETSNASKWVEIGDVNGDARNDVIASRGQDAACFVFLQSESGESGIAVASDHFVANYSLFGDGQAFALACADINSDGRNDIVVLTPYSASIGLFLAR